MVGIAIDTIVVSSRIMKKPRHSAPSAAHGLACLAFIVVFPGDEAQVALVVVVLERDPPGAQVVEEPFGPLELELPVVALVAPVEPVDLRRAVPGEVVEHGLVGGDAGAQPRDAVLELEQGRLLAQLVDDGEPGQVGGELLDDVAQQFAAALAELVQPGLGHAVDGPLGPPAVALRVDDLDETAAVQAFHGVVERSRLHVDPGVDVPLAHELGHLVRVHGFLVEQLQHGEAERGQLGRGHDRWSLRMTPGCLFHVDYTAQTSARSTATSVTLRTRCESREGHLQGSKIPEGAPHGFSQNGQSAFRPASSRGIIRNPWSVRPPNVCRCAVPDGAWPYRSPARFHVYSGTCAGSACPTSPKPACSSVRMTTRSCFAKC